MTEALPHSTVRARTEDRGPEPQAFRIRAYPAAWRWLEAALALIAGASMPVILAAVLLASDPPVTPPVLMRLFALLTITPTLAAGLVRWAFAAAADVQSEHLVLRRRDLRVEVPAEAIAAVKPWLLPLPGVGFNLRLPSGRRFAYGLCADDAGELLRTLAKKSGVAPAAAAAHHPIIVYADARQPTARWRWYHSVLKFPFFALLPTAVLFNAHQHIAYGGTLGQYYLQGLGAYLATFAEHWATLTIYLVLYAAVWRGVAEACALAAAFGGLSPAIAVRRAVEFACRVVYYGGVPILLALRFAG